MWFTHRTILYALRIGVVVSAIYSRAITNYEHELAAGNNKSISQCKYYNGTAFMKWCMGLDYIDCIYLPRERFL